MKKVLSVLLTLILVLSCIISCKSKEDEELTRALEVYRENKMASYEDENEKYDDYEVDVAFIGDSLTDGYDLKKYYPDLTVSNRGIGADTTFDVEKRLKVSLYDLKPKVAVMLIGANNFETMFENYENLLIGFKENLPNTKIILLSLTSMSGEWGKNNRIAAYNNVKIKLLAEKYSFAYVDLYSALLNLESGEIFPEYTTDGGHLTPRGYEVITAKITPEIERALALWNEENK